MKNKLLIIIVFVLTIFTGCDRQTPEPISKIVLKEDVDYICYLNETITINFLENDEIIGEAIVEVDNPSNGKMELQSDGFSYLYTPNSGFIGADVFTYKVCNGDHCEYSKIKVQVAPTLNACEAIFEAQDDYIKIESNVKYSFPIDDIIENDIACEIDKSADYVTIIFTTTHGKLERLTNNYLVYTPNEGYRGEDVFEYQIISTSNYFLKKHAKVHFAVGIEMLIE